MPATPEDVCKWIDQQSALRTFARYSGSTQIRVHIKPLHHYVACRLVLEGGFPPEDITPRPPFRADRSGGRWLLMYDENIATSGKRTLLGGLKTKTVDIVIMKNGLGPAVAISCNSAIQPFQAVGDCTNLHIAYPTMVTGFLFVMRAHTQAAAVAATASTGGSPGRGRAIGQSDVEIQGSGEPVEAIVRIHNAWSELTGRRDIRDDVSRYEAVAFLLVEASGPNAGKVILNYPVEDSPLRIERFFKTLYQRYDERYVYSAPDFKSVTRRRQWSPKSPVFDNSLRPAPFLGALDYQPRIE